MSMQQGMQPCAICARPRPYAHIASLNISMPPINKPNNNGGGRGQPCMTPAIYEKCHTTFSATLNCIREYIGCITFKCPSNPNPGGTPKTVDRCHYPAFFKSMNAASSVGNQSIADSHVQLIDGSLKLGAASFASVHGRAWLQKPAACLHFRNRTKTDYMCSIYLH